MAAVAWQGARALFNAPWGNITGHLAGGARSFLGATSASGAIGGLIGGGAKALGSFAGAMAPTLAMGAAVYAAPALLGHTIGAGMMQNRDNYNFLNASLGGFMGLPGSGPSGRGVGFAPAANMTQAMQRRGAMPFQRYEQVEQAMRGFVESGVATAGIRGVSDISRNLDKAFETVGEIMEVMNTTIDEASKIFERVRRMGITGKAATLAYGMRSRVQGGMIGVSADAMMGLGAEGAGMARSMGLYGYGGAGLMQGMATGMGMGLRSGAVDEALFREVTGGSLDPMEAARALSGKTAAYLQGPGQYLVAGLMGKGGKIDTAALQDVISGRTTMAGTLGQATGRVYSNMNEFLTNRQALTSDLMSQAGEFMPALIYQQVKAEAGTLGSDPAYIQLLLQQKGYSEAEAKSIIQAGSPEAVRSMMQARTMSQDTAVGENLRRTQVGLGAVWERGARRPFAQMLAGARGMGSRISGQIGSAAEGFLTSMYGVTASSVAGSGGMFSEAVTTDILLGRSGAGRVSEYGNLSDAAAYDAYGTSMPNRMMREIMGRGFMPATRATGRDFALADSISVPGNVSSLIFGSKVDEVRRVFESSNVGDNIRQRELTLRGSGGMGLSDYVRNLSGAGGYSDTEITQTLKDMANSLGAIHDVNKAALNEQKTSTGLLRELDRQGLTGAMEIAMGSKALAGMGLQSTQTFSGGMASLMRSALGSLGSPADTRGDAAAISLLGNSFTGAKAGAWGQHIGFGVGTVLGGITGSMALPGAGTVLGSMTGGALMAGFADDIAGSLSWAKNKAFSGIDAVTGTDFTGVRALVSSMAGDRDLLSPLSVLSTKQGKKANRFRGTMQDLNVSLQNRPELLASLRERYPGLESAASALAMGQDVSKLDPSIHKAAIALRETYLQATGELSGASVTEKQRYMQGAAGIVRQYAKFRGKSVEEVIGRANMPTDGGAADILAGTTRAENLGESATGTAYGAFLGGKYHQKVITDLLRKQPGDKHHLTGEEMDMFYSAGGSVRGARALESEIRSAFDLKGGGQTVAAEDILNRAGITDETTRTKFISQVSKGNVTGTMFRDLYTQYMASGQGGGTAGDPVVTGLSAVVGRLEKAMDPFIQALGKAGGAVISQTGEMPNNNGSGPGRSYIMIPAGNQ